MEALAILQKHDYSISRAADSMGMNRETLKSWRRKYGSNIAQALHERVVAAQVIDDVATRDQTLLDRYYGVKNLILDRMLEIIGDEKNLDNLQKCLKTLSEIDGTSRAKSNGDPEKMNPTMNVYQQVNAHLISIGYGPKDNDQLNGDTAE